MSSTTPKFSTKTLAFLRALKRHNDREWFRAHRDEYEAHVRLPMIALIERLGPELRRYAPDLMADPRISLYRIYRDTRFAADKSPFKTHAAAIFPCRGLEKHEGAGLYLHIAPGEVWIGGGLYAPTSQGLLLVREAIVSDPAAFRRIVGSKRFKDAVGQLEGERLQRVPRGFPADHPAADFLKQRQFLAGRQFPASLASSPRFHSEITRVFRAVAPLVNFLNEPVLAKARRGGREARE